MKYIKINEEILIDILLEKSKINEQETEISLSKSSHEEIRNENKRLKDEIAAHIELSKSIINSEHSKHQDNMISLNQCTQTDDIMDNQLNILQLNSLIQLQSEIKSKDEEITKLQSERVSNDKLIEKTKELTIKNKEIKQQKTE